MTHSAQFLPMFGINKQQLRRGGINAAYLQISSTGLQDACVTLFRQLIQVWDARPQDQVFMNDLERIFPAPLASTVQARLEGMAELADPGLDAEEQRKRLLTIQAIRARTVNRAARDAFAHAERSVQEGLAKLQRSLQLTFATGPNKMRPVVDQVRRGLQDLNFPAIDSEPVARWQRCHKALDQLTSRRGSLSPGTLEFVSSHLRNQAHRLYEQAVGVLAQELAEESLSHALPKVQSYLDELAAHGADFASKMAATLAALEQRQKDAAQDQHVSRASVVLPLPGPDEKQVLAGMIARHSCADLRQLATRFLDTFEARLRDIAPHLCPYLDASAACLADLVRAIEPKQLAETFVRLAEESMGAGHTVYEVIAQHGLEDVADFLYRRATPTCHLGDRGVEAFNISLLELTIVRLPPAVGPRDPQLRADFIKAFGRKPCTFAEGAVGDRTLTVVRVLIGWPIGIADENRPLLERYLRSAQSGHLPHLIGLVPDAPLGTVSTACKQLALEHRA